ncbi:uncharacterized protein DS421_18g629720 [Arachis hypogaea]|nr:uncharacterized protein DS421_18g629720 [Arachis hypogaea]
MAAPMEAATREQNQSANTNNTKKFSCWTEDEHSMQNTLGSNLNGEEHVEDSKTLDFIQIHITSRFELRSSHRLRLRVRGVELYKAHNIERLKLASGTYGLKLLSTWVWCRLSGYICIGIELEVLGGLLVVKAYFGLF